MDQSVNPLEPSFQRFQSACTSVFQIITLDNWYEVYIYYSQKTNQTAAMVIYVVTLILFGNFILLNLLIAIMQNYIEVSDDLKILFED